MKLSTIFWPWGRMLELERELAKNDHERVKLAAEAVRAWQASETDRYYTKQYSDRLVEALAQHRDLTRELQSAHFRDPATGRLGRKGERFYQQGQP